MKTIKHITLGILIAAASINFTSCKGKEKAEAPKGEFAIKIECSGKDYFSTKSKFRASAVGESLDQATAKKKAMSNAKAELAGSIQTTIKATIDNYVNSREFNNKEQIEERFEGLTREVIDQKLSGVKLICEEPRGTPQGKTKYYVCLELGADDLVDAINERLTKDESLRIDYDYEKFKETFNAEMEKMEGK
jgi:transposase